MGLRDDLDNDSSFSASSELGVGGGGIDNPIASSSSSVGVNLDRYLDEIEKTLSQERNRKKTNHGGLQRSSTHVSIRSLPGEGAINGGGSSSHAYTNSTFAEESDIYTSPGATYRRYEDPHIHHHPPHHFHNLHHHSLRPIPSTSQGADFITTINVDDDPPLKEPKNNTSNISSSLQLIWRNLTYTSKPPSCFSPNPKPSSNGGKRLTILEKQSGSIEGGQITAIIGPSGAGKSTLLECLAGRRKTGLKGDIYVSFERVSSSRVPRHPPLTPVKISLIGQKDEAIGVLTVREVLTFASRIKNYARVGPIGVGSSRYVTPPLVESVLEELSLQKCADTKVNRISGGQLKRLCFGVELISGPDIILLDEPTSGLDASSAYSCVVLLKKLTDLRRNIFYHRVPSGREGDSTSGRAPAILCSIHQPSSRVLNHFDRIYVLSFDGRCIYQGSPRNLLSTLSSMNLICPQFHNPADFIIEIASGDYGMETVNRLAIRESDRQLSEQKSEKIISVGSKGMAVKVGSDRLIYLKVSRVIERMKNNSFPTLLHTYLLWKRTLISNLREPKLTWFRLFQAVFIALLMSFLYDYPIGEPDGCYPHPDQPVLEIKSTEDNIAFVFFITLFTVMASMMPTVLTFPSEVSILLQERNNGWYSCATYYVAKVIAELPLQFIITVTFIAIIYPMTGQVLEWQRFGYFCLICLLISSIAQCVGILFGTYYVKSVENAVFLAPLSMAPVFLLSGFFGKLSAIPLVLKPLAYVSYVRYAFEALLITLYGMGRCSPKSSRTNLFNSSFLPSASDNVPSHLLNTGYVSRGEIENYANRNRGRRNNSTGGRAIFNRFYPANGFWDPNALTTISPTYGSIEEATSPSSEIFTTHSTLGFQDHGDHHHEVEGVTAGLPPHLLLNSTSGSTGSFDLFSGGSYVLKRFDVSEDALYVNLVILSSFLIILRILCYIILLNKTNQRK